MAENNDARDNNVDGETPAELNIQDNFNDDELTGEERKIIEKLFMGEGDDDLSKNISEQMENLKLNAMKNEVGSRSLFINFDNVDVVAFMPSLREVLKKNPAKTIETLEGILKKVLKEKTDEFGDDFTEMGYFHVRPVPNMPRGESGFDELRSKMIGKFVTLRGIVTSITKVKPFPKTVVFYCAQCGTDYKLNVDEFSVYHPPPKVCPNEQCPSKGKARWNMSIFESRYIDFQKVTIQEEPEFLRTREQARSVRIALMDDLVASIKPGTRVVANGIMVATPTLNESKKTYDYFLFDTHVLGLNIESQKNEEDETEKITDEREKQVMDFVENMKGKPEEYLDFLIDAVAPMIEGYRIIKLAILCVLFGGQTYVPDRSSRIRGNIHALLMGDPGCGKTKIIESVRSLCHRYEYGSGQSASKAGLTASVVKEDNDVELQAGLTVRSDGGIAAIDEFEKMNKEDRSALHEQMESQRVTIHKWKFHETLNARSSVIAGANPKYGQLRPISEKTIQDQMSDIPPAILSRFDAIFLIEDVPNRPRDRAIITKMLEARSKQYAKPLDYLPSENDDENVIQEHVNFVRDLITIAKRKADENPIGISDEASEEIMKYYLDKRDKCLDHETGKKRSDMPIPIAARQFGSLHRFSVAIAKMFFANEINPYHFKKAKTIVEKSMEQVAMDEDGNIDAGLMATGKSKAVIDKEDLLLRAINRLEKEGKKRDPKEKGAKTKELKEYVLAYTDITEKMYTKTYNELLNKYLVKEFEGGDKVKMTAEGRRQIGLA